MASIRSAGVGLMVVAAAVAAACGGSSKKTSTPTAAPAVASTAGKTAVGTAVAVNPATQAALAPRPTVMPVGTSSASGGKTYTAAQAKAIVDAASLMPADIETGWAVMSDTTTDNAAAATADPAGAASITRCGRLLGRTLVSQPPDVVSSFLTGLSVAAFSTITVYATNAGALDCATEAATRFQKPGELARAFGTVFVDANAVTVVPVDYPQFADGSFAVNLTGKVNASGTVVDLSILVIGFRRGNVSAAVGTAHSSGSIDPSEATPYINLVLQRLAANQ